MTASQGAGNPQAATAETRAQDVAYDAGAFPTVPPSEPERPATATAANETLEDYTLRFAPRSYRRWGTGVVATSALGGIAYLADFAIGANIGIAHGTTNALWGILIAAVIIFVTGFPLAYYAARYNIDLDLITRGSGFGYYGSVLTNVIFATFTFIFFALEGSIMAQGLQLGLGIPLWLGYAVSTLMVIPLVIYGMKALAKLQVWTTPLWLVLFVIPMVYLLVSHPDSVETFFAYQGADGDGAPSFAVDDAGRRRLPVADGADRRADRLPAVHAAADRRQPAVLVACGDPGRTGLGHLRRRSSRSSACSSRSTSSPG